MKVVSTDDNCPLHFHLDDDTLKDPATDVHVAGERTFLVNVVTLDGFSGGLESQTNVFVEPAKNETVIERISREFPT